MAEIIKTSIFSNFPEIITGVSTKIGLERKAPYYFNVSLTVGDDEAIVKENREHFFEELGINYSNVAFQFQIHSDIIRYVSQPGFTGESDAMITDKPGIALAVSTADCAAVLLYDAKNKVIAGVHSGWKGTAQQITSKTLKELSVKFSTKPENLYAYIAPSISPKNYEVGIEVAEKFDPKYYVPKNGKFLLDVQSANYDMLINFGIPKNQIEVSELCSYQEKELLHSYRRDGKISGRALAVIYKKGINAG